MNTQSTVKYFTDDYSMSGVLNELKDIVENVPLKLQKFAQSGETEEAKPGEWSKKELLGHLIDSASNNHLRFVKAQIDGELHAAGYEQEEWVKLQRYDLESWETLITLWKTYNTHLLHLIAHIPEDKFDRLCYVGNNPPLTLRELIYDYLGHLKHHLRDLVG